MVAITSCPYTEMQWRIDDVTFHSIISCLWFLRVQLTIIEHWFRQWLGAGKAMRHYLNQWWLVYRRIYASLGLNKLNMQRNPTCDN